MADDPIVQMASDPDFAKMPLAEQQKALSAHDPNFKQLGAADITRFVQAHQGARQPSVPSFMDAADQAKQQVLSKMGNISEYPELQNAKPSGPSTGGRFGGSPMREPDIEGTVNALPAVGGGIGGALGGVPGAALGGIAGEGIKQAISPAAGMQRSDNPPAAMLGQGALQGTFEGGGQLLNYAGSKLGPAVLKRVAGSLLKDKMDMAGKAIDTYLSQPNLATAHVDVATPVNNMLDTEIAKATRAGADSLAKRLTELKGTWNTNYNLSSPTLLEANKFRREIGDFTTFAGEANKDTINKIQRQVVGIVGDRIASVVPGVQPLNDSYANLVSTQAAVKQSAKKLTSGFVGTGVAAAGAGIKKIGQALPTAARVAEQGNQQ